MITISACLIVKNEEEVLARCLDSLQGVYDELIIVDTGSTDRTMEIARKYTQKVYTFEWIQDFAAARNYLFSKATKDYIYVADADEVLDLDQREKFLQLKQVLLPEIEIVQMKYSNQLAYNTTYNFDEEYRPKLYKRVRSFVWTDPVHESVVLDPVVYDSEIIISHRPTSNHAPRDFELFQNVLKKTGTLSLKLKKMYARELYITGKDEDFLKAEPYFKQWTKEQISMEEMKLYFCVLMRAARIRADLMQMFTISVKAFAAELASSELCFEIGELYAGKKEYAEAATWFYNAVYESQSELNIHYQGDFSLQRLADCEELLQNHEVAAEYRKLAGDWKSESVQNQDV